MFKVLGQTLQQRACIARDPILLGYGFLSTCCRLFAWRPGGAARWGQPDTQKARDAAPALAGRELTPAFSHTACKSKWISSKAPVGKTCLPQTTAAKAPSEVEEWPLVKSKYVVSGGSFGNARPLSDICSAFPTGFPHEASVHVSCCGPGWMRPVWDPRAFCGWGRRPMSESSKTQQAVVSNKLNTGAGNEGAMLEGQGPMLLQMATWR